MSQGKIRKIVIGSDPIKGLAFSVGQKVGIGLAFEVTQILKDTAVYHKFGSVEYLVYVKSDNTEEELWKEFKDIPVAVEYFLGLGEE